MMMVCRDVVLRASCFVFILFILSFVSVKTAADGGAGSNDNNNAASDEQIKDYAQVTPPNSVNTILSETFNGEWEDTWKISKNPDYQGEWIVDEGDSPHKVKGDKGLIVNSVARKHAIVAKFNRVLDNTDKDLTVQYELRLQKDLDCGGAYIKLLTTSSLPADLSKFSNDVPYTIMFGPDKCGGTNKIHFIVRHKNPVTGIYEEKHLANPPSMKTDTITHHYKLQVRRDNTFTITVDGDSVKEGNLLEDFNPSFNPPKEIDDPTDKKPATWVDEDKIPDKTAVKPDDWDESAPATIADLNDVKPADWLDNEPKTIPDPEATKPEDWDDDLDGDWEAPQVPNPKCVEFGCGEWKPRYIPNPNYKGKWSPPLIDNPTYIGEWYPKKIPNPHFFVEDHPHNFDSMSALGIEIWTMKDGILFDNILITHDESEADAFTKATWVKKHADEQAVIDAEVAEKSPSFIKQVQQSFEILIQYFSDPDNILVVAGSLVVAIIVPILMCFLFSGGTSSSSSSSSSSTERPSPSPSEHSKEDKKKKKKKAD